MMEVKVLGSGCANCRNTIRLIEEVARERGVEVRVEKVERMEDIVAAGVHQLAVDDHPRRSHHAGGVPRREAIAAWLQSA